MSVVSLFAFPSSRHCQVLFSALLVAWAPLAADTPPATRHLQLANGDRISGELIKETELHVVIRSDFLGEITIPRSALSAPESTPTASLKSTPPTPPAPVVAKAKPPPKPAAAPEKQGVKPTAKPWRSKIEFGFLHESGRNDTSRQHLLAQTEKTAGPHNLRFHGRLSYAKQNKKNTANRSEASFRWRKNLANHTFTQTQSSYYRDEIAAIDINLEQNFGLGYRLIDDDRHTFNIGAGLTGQYREADTTDANTGALAEFFQDQTFKFNATTKLVQTLTLQYWPSAPLASAAATRDEENLKWRFSTTLVGKLSSHLSLNLRYEYDFDNAVANPAARDNQRITSSLGYMF